MNPSDEQKGTGVPAAGEVSSPGSEHAVAPDRVESGEPAVQPADPQDSYEDGYPHEPEPAPPPPPPQARPRACDSAARASACAVGFDGSWAAGGGRKNSTAAASAIRRRR